jgi:hypothetical protein
MPMLTVKFVDIPAAPEVVKHRPRPIGSGDSAWEIWQCQVVDLLRSDLFPELQVTTLDDVDWLTWQPFFSQGRSPRQAIERALERVP